jgi:hypothetical protein
MSNPGTSVKIQRSNAASFADSVGFGPREDHSRSCKTAKAKKGWQYLSSHFP